MLVQERNSGTKPSGRSSKPAFTEYTIRYVTGRHARTSGRRKAGPVGAKWT
ncbi:MAG TPA: hypothetical protein VGF38_24155 [Ktedonobacterales bacterium]